MTEQTFTTLTAMLRELDAAGWKLVPKEPTAEMINAFRLEYNDGSGQQYRAFIAAAPKYGCHDDG